MTNKEAKITNKYKHRHTDKQIIKQITEKVVKITQHSFVIIRRGKNCKGRKKEDVKKR